ncbi:hypothetical protein L3Q82_016028 [Scortum barcoo]|uniref:Uncharacterized protein n=1 Tax=Scortum barcoo TaxID=214431 RepID=A0ACB8VQ72_9TELE|nr:hypothetical protein L3Q82_016028 [Scortum barcoo]
MFEKEICGMATCVSHGSRSRLGEPVYHCWGDAGYSHLGLCCFCPSVAISTDQSVLLVLEEDSGPAGALCRLCGGYRFCYSYRGKPGMRPSILMLHGFSAHKDTWLTVVKYLPKHLHIVCVDMPGHEGTTRTRTDDYSIQGQVRRIHQFVEAIRLNRKPFHLVGTSMGGNVAGVYAACYPSEICSMTLICPDGIRHPCETKFDNHLQDLEHSNYTLNIPLIPTTPEEMEDMFRLCSHVRFKIPQQILQGLVDVRQPHNMFYQEVFMEIFGEKSRYALQEHLHLITAPLQVIWGKQDQVMCYTNKLVFICAGGGRLWSHSHRRGLTLLQGGPAGEVRTLRGDGEATSDGQAHPGLHHPAARCQRRREEILLKTKDSQSLPPPLVQVVAAGPPPLLRPPPVRSFAAARSRAQLPGATSGEHRGLAAPLDANVRLLLLGQKHADKDRLSRGNEPMSTPVTLNVGGHLYTTSLSTLQRYPDSMLGAMFRGDFPTTRDSQGNYFIDRDGTLFRYILNFLRTSELTLPVDFTETDLLRKEADFYQIEPLIQCLNDPKPLYPPDIFEQVVELSSTRKLSKYSNPVAVIITQLTITTKVHGLLEGISNNFTKWNKHMMDTRDCQVSFTFGPCDYHQEVSLRVHLMDYIMKQGFTIRNTRVHHMSERANENTVEHHWTFCRPAHKVED